MHFVKEAQYLTDYKLLLTFENGAKKTVDLKPYLDGEIFEPLKNIAFFKKVRVNPELDTIVWENNADVSPDFLYEIGAELEVLLASPKEANPSP